MTGQEGGRSARARCRVLPSPRSWTSRLQGLLSSRVLAGFQRREEEEVWLPGRVGLPDTAEPHCDPAVPETLPTLALSAHIRPGGVSARLSGDRGCAWDASEGRLLKITKMGKNTLFKNFLFFNLIPR